MILFNIKAFLRFLEGFLSLYNGSRPIIVSNISLEPIITAFQGGFKKDQMFYYVTYFPFSIPIGNRTLSCNKIFIAMLSFINRLDVHGHIL